MKIDDLDRKLINNLQRDARLSFRKLGAMLGVPHTTVFTRVNKLVRQGIIKRFSAVLHPHDLGFKMNYIVIDTPKAESKGIAESLAACDDVMKVFTTTDGKVIVKSIAANDSPGCAQDFETRTDNKYPVTVYPIGDVVKYDHNVCERFVKKL